MSALPAGMRLARMLTLGDHTDETGRLLLEDSAPDQAIRRVTRAGVAMTTTSCPYQDTPSRLGGTMNVAAYEALRHDTAEMLDGFAWLATNYLGVHPSKRSTVRGLFDVSHLGITLPLVLFHRGVDPVAGHGAMPSYVASIFKASRGVNSVAVTMLAAKGPTAEVGGADVLTFADQKGALLRAGTRRVCAGPTRLIERTLDVILSGEGGDGSRSALGDLIDFPTLWEFYSLEDSMGEALSSYRFTLDNLTSTAGASDPEKLFSCVIMEEGRSQSFGEYTEGVLARANDVQVRLNRLMGRTENATPLEFADLLRLL